MKDLKYYKDNCEEDYLHTPISVLRYITELEKEVESKPLIIDSVIEPKGTCCLNLKKVGKVNDMFESWDECENCGKEIV